jgi:hypothetical protein
VLLVPDKNTQFVLRGVLQRFQALGIRPIEFEFRTHPGRDGGVRSTGAGILAGEHRRFNHALMLIDHEGSGAEKRSAIDLEDRLDGQLGIVWGSRAKAIVIDPEVDVWVWGAENIMRNLLDWQAAENVRDWLKAHGHSFDSAGKPKRPKEAMELLVKFRQQPRSSALYEKLASRISLHRCSDAAYLRMRAKLREWFPTEA